MIAGMAALAVARPALGLEQTGAWQAWRDRFVAPDGRVIDDGNGGISHSEGQAYGQILAEVFDDREAFERMERWTRDHIANRQDALMSWKWDPSRPDSIPDWHNATDGDLLRAWAHLRAARDRGWPVDQEVPAAITRDIVGLCLAPDPRRPDALLLMPGAEALSQPDRVLVNPSYYHPRAMRELADAYGQPDLARAADHGETLLAELAATGLLPDWVTVTPKGFVDPRDHDYRSSYDALRIPIYLAWSGRGDHPAVAGMATMLARADLPDHVAVRVEADGAVTAISNEPGYRAIAQVASDQIVPLSPGDFATQPYFPATLQMLAYVAHAESRG